MLGCSVISIVAHIRGNVEVAMGAQRLMDEIIGAFYIVYNALGYGFERAVYLEALILELESLGLSCRADQSVPRFDTNPEGGRVRAALGGYDSVMISVSDRESLSDAQECGFSNAVLSTEFDAGLLLNFGMARRSCGAITPVPS
jgi:GxxExxY protein